MTQLVHIGRFETLRLLGRGGMGEVYLARDPLIGRHVAVKVLADSFDAAARERFTREARAAGRLDHPHIVTIFDVGEHDGRPFIAMEYVPGETLAALIRKPEPPSRRELLGLVDDACAGLAFAHRAGVVHLDVKPENLIRHDDGRTRILDFGIARVVTADETHTRHVLGTLRYMSPEQLNGGDVDHRSDVFGIGCVLYEVVAGQPAFGATWPEVLARVAGDTVPRLADIVPDVHPELDRIAQKAMAKNPAARYDDLETLREELAEVRAALPEGPGRPATVRAAPLRPPTSRGTAAANVAAPAPVVPARPNWVVRSAAIAAVVIGVSVWYRASGPAVLQQVAPTLPTSASTTTPSAEAPPAAAPAGPSAADFASEVWRAVARRDRAAALALLRAQPALAPTILGELSAAARTGADDARRAADARGRAARETDGYRSGVAALARAQRADAAGPTLDGLTATWEAADAFTRAAPPATAPKTAAPAPTASAPPEMVKRALETAEQALAGRPIPSSPAPLPRPPVVETVRGGEASPAASSPRERTATAAPATVVPAPPPAIDPPAAPGLSPEVGARAAIAAYQAAYAARDVAALARVYPGLSAEQREALTRTFAEAVSYGLGVRVTALTVGEATVTAMAEVTHALVPKVGSPSRTTQSARFTLAPMGGGWVIQRIETTR